VSLLLEARADQDNTDKKPSCQKHEFGAKRAKRLHDLMTKGLAAINTVGCEESKEDMGACINVIARYGYQLGKRKLLEDPGQLLNGVGGGGKCDILRERGTAE
jgi:hypothetical protein